MGPAFLCLFILNLIKKVIKQRCTSTRWSLIYCYLGSSPTHLRWLYRLWQTEIFHILKRNLINLFLVESHGMPLITQAPLFSFPVLQVKHRPDGDEHSKDGRSIIIKTMRHLGIQA